MSRDLSNFVGKTVYACKQCNKLLLTPYKEYKVIGYDGLYVLIERNDLGNAGWESPKQFIEFII